MGTAKSYGIEGFRERLLNYTQDKSYGARLWRSKFSTRGRTRYWDTLFSHCGDFGGVLNWKQ